MDHLSTVIEWQSLVASYSRYRSEILRSAREPDVDHDMSIVSEADICLIVSEENVNLFDDKSKGTVELFEGKLRGIVSLKVNLRELSSERKSLGTHGRVQDSP